MRNNCPRMERRVKSERVVLVVSDPHCGHKVGLTHPDFDSVPSKNNSVEYALWKYRRECWNWCCATAKEIKPDIVILNGDAVDGKGDKTGGTELITSDRGEQVDMAVALLEQFGARNIYISFGTPYHSGNFEDWEKQVADKVHADKIGSHDWLSVNGLVLDYRHHVSSSSVPYGRTLSISRERTWNLMWSDKDYGFPRADVLIRSHVHYFSYAGGRGWLAMTTPALQGIGTKFGARRMSGTVDFGVVSFKIRDKENWTWQYHLLEASKRLPIEA